MGMIKTGNPIPTAPTELIQGYLDGIAGKMPQVITPIRAVMIPALLVKEGKADPPAWSLNV